MIPLLFLFFLDKSHTLKIQSYFSMKSSQSKPNPKSSFLSIFMTYDT
jgi:hypothetical protein